MLNALVLSGGGLAGLAYIGVLRFLKMNGLDRGIRTAAGTSMGAFFVVAWATGMSIADMEAMIYDIFTDKEFTHYEPQALLGILSPETLGMDDGQRYVRALRSRVGDMTFIEFAKSTGKDIVLCATCLETKAATYFSVRRTPDVKVADALRASMAIPFLTTPVAIGERHYVDGGLTDNLPVDAVAEGGKINALVCSIDLGGCEETQCRWPCQGVLDYIRLIMDIFQKGMTKAAAATAPDIVLDHCPLPLIRFKCSSEGMAVDVSRAEIDASILYGFHKARVWWEASRAASPPPP